MPEPRRPGFPAETFEFARREFDPASGQLRLAWRLDELELVEVLDFGPGPAADAPGLEAALDALHWIAGTSYFKAACPPRLVFAGSRPDHRQARALDRIYREGLAEFAWVNGLDPEDWPRFPGGEKSGRPASSPLARRSLVPLGGGKDSLVALERVRASDPVAPVTVQVGQAALISRVAGVAGCEHRVIGRRLAPELAGLNAAGAWNGHVPVTAINVAILTVAALLWGFDRVVFANERSADEPSLVAEDGRAVNHQFSKSFAFEALWQDWVRRSIHSDLKVFSILRRDRELAVCREFAGLERYHEVFSSCNRNFHLDGPRTSRWCCECPKCRFVFLGLAPFLPPERLVEIFGVDLLADAEQVEGFRSLLAPEGAKPFECVGEAAEARAALAALAVSPSWRSRRVVRELAAEVATEGAGLNVADLEVLLAPSGAHRIPADLLDAA